MEKENVFFIVVLIGVVFGLFVLYMGSGEDGINIMRNKDADRGLSMFDAQTVQGGTGDTAGGLETTGPGTGSEEVELGIEILEEGTGEEAKQGNTVVVHYTGTLESGLKFDSSVDKGIPYSFTIGAGTVIKGWDIGVEGMKAGEKRKLTIPPQLGYGQRGVGLIPPNATLIFEIELLEIKSEGEEQG